MKKNLMIGMLVLNLASLTAFAAEAETLRPDCAKQVQGIVLLASGYLPDEFGNDDQLEADLKRVEITDVRKISESPTSGAPNITSTAKVKGEGIKGTVRVQATRGGCFVTKVSLAAIAQ
jgi:hypothetical protein